MAGTAKDEKRRPTAAELGKDLAVTVGFNTVIAGFFAVAMDVPLRATFVSSNLVGLSIFLVSAGLALFAPRLSRGAIALLGVLLGGAVGVALASLAIGSVFYTATPPRFFMALLSGALVFGAGVSYFFHARERITASEARLREELLERVSSEKRLAEANLKLLQAQIEPHFLFNTLSNVIYLIDERPQDARRMLLDLTSYLRASLRRTRAGETTVGDALEIVQAYLEIQAMRLGSRLRYQIDASADCRALPLPPLLLQPLVENAVLHGVEPRPGGGALSVRATREDGALVLEVADTGVGLAPEAPQGVGLENVRSRVREIFRGEGRLLLRPNAPRGLVAQLSLPIAAGEDPREAA